MIKKTVTFEDYSEPPQEVTEDFYFNINKLEAVEIQLEHGDLEETIKKISESENTKDAYDLFKQILLSAYGEKAADGRGFEKEDANGRPLSKKLAASPALSEIIFELLENPEAASEFMEGMLPAKMVAAGKAAMAEKLSQQQVTDIVVKAGELQANPETAVAPTAPEKKFEDYSRPELLAMSKDKFDGLVGTDPTKMSRDQLTIAMQRKL